jgi:TonB family protein
MCGFLLGACLGIAVAAMMPAWADANGTPTSQTAPISFDIGAQPLEAALDAYGAASGVQVLYRTSLTAGRHSARVHGVFMPEAALKVLLAGTGLTVRYTTNDSFTLVPQPVDRSPAMAATYRPPDMMRYGDFLGAAQAGVLDVLCRNPETRPGRYRITIKFWVDPAGAVLKTALLASTGDAAHDDAIVDALSHMRVGEAPPADMPQPITMVISARPPDVTGDCAAAAR